MNLKLIRENLTDKLWSEINDERLINDDLRIDTWTLIWGDADGFLIGVYEIVSFDLFIILIKKSHKQEGVSIYLN